MSSGALPGRKGRGLLKGGGDIALIFEVVY